MISLVLSCATNETDNPDLRDRAFIYWRLLSTDPEVCGRRSAGVSVCQGSVYAGGQTPLTAQTIITDRRTDQPQARHGRGAVGGAGDRGRRRAGRGARLPTDNRPNRLTDQPTDQPQAAKDVVLSEKPVIVDDGGRLEPLLLDRLIGQIATLASIYHKWVPTCHVL
jgi:hypothetical protein